MADMQDTTRDLPQERDDAPGLLHDEVERGQRLDRELARDLGRPEPRRARPDERYLASLSTDAPDPGAQRALVAAAQAGDAEARARLVEACLPGVLALARTYRSGRVERAELLQEGVVGVLRALERFDPGRGVPFWAYASWWVRQAMQQLVSELTHPVVLSDRALRHLARLKDAHAAELQAGHAAAREGLAQRSGLTVEQVDDLLAVQRRPRSLDEPVPSGADEVGTFGELVADPLAEGEYERVLSAIEAEQLHGLLAALSERERGVLRARYGLDGDEHTLREVGEQLGLSRERVHQIERRALGKLAAAWTSAP